MHGGNAILHVFVVFYIGKEFAVKKVLTGLTHLLLALMSQCTNPCECI